MSAHRFAPIQVFLSDKPQLYFCKFNLHRVISINAEPSIKLQVPNDGLTSLQVGPYECGWITKCLQAMRYHMILS